MKKLILLSLCLTSLTGSFAQLKDVRFKFYGQVRTDLYYNSRANEETVDGLFYMYPKDRVRDEDGHDLNSTPNSNFYSAYSRFGVNVSGVSIGKANATAVIEGDFRGTGTSLNVVRLRHAYFNLAWQRSTLLLGQTWHPFYGDVATQILNLASGAPYQPFSRAPQVRYRYTGGHLQLTAAAVWQSQYTSQGPAGKSVEYIKKSCIPELFAGVNYLSGGFLAGVGVSMLSLTPRTEATGSNGMKYKVDERITSLSCEAHVKYTNDHWYVAAKSTLGSNMTQASGLGGFGVKSTDSRTGKQEYTPLRFSSSWLNVVYGQKWKPGIFVGYAKNLGTTDALDANTPTLYGTGTNLDQLTTAGAELTYNLPHWKFGVEYTLSTAWYGSLNASNGKIRDTHAVSNNRLVMTAMFTF